MPQPQEPERVWHYFIDSDGHLWHDGAEFDDPKVLNLFMKGMTELPKGEARPPENWRVFCQGEECRIAAEDVPYVIQDVEVHTDRVVLTFPGGYEEDLNPETLFVGPGNVLYCRVRDGKFTARFNRRSYLDLAKRIQYDSHKDAFYLVVDNERYSIAGV